MHQQFNKFDIEMEIRTKNVPKGVSDTTLIVISLGLLEQPLRVT